VLTAIKHLKFQTFEIIMKQRLRKQTSGNKSICRIQWNVSGQNWDFTVLCGIPARTSDENGVRLSVRWSLKCVDCDKTEERSVQIFITYERSFSLVFWEEWLVGVTPTIWNFGSFGPRWSKIANFELMQVAPQP